LTHDDNEAAYRFLAADPCANVMMMSVIREWGCGESKVREFYGDEQHGRLQGIVSFARDVALFGAPDSCRAFAQLALQRNPLPTRLISPSRDVGDFWSVYQAAPLPLLFDRRQVLYRLALRDLRGTPFPALREATRDDWPALVESGAAMNKEELGIDPLVHEPDAFRARVLLLIERRRLYFLADERGVTFQAAINSQTPQAAQISSVYTRPDQRGRGLATRGLAELCRRRLSFVESCCLFVNDFNASARRTYEKIGFSQVGEFRAIFLESPA
jgi:hypothetical protein